MVTDSLTFHCLSPQVTLEKLALNQAHSRYDVQMEYVLPGEGSRFAPEDTIVSAAAKVTASPTCTSSYFLLPWHDQTVNYVSEPSNQSNQAFSPRNFGFAESVETLNLKLGFQDLGQRCHLTGCSAAQQQKDGTVGCHGPASNIYTKGNGS